MTISGKQTTSENRVSIGPRAHGRWYVLATVALACFLITVTVWQRPPRSHTAKIVVTQLGHHGQLDDRGAIVAAIVEIHEQHAHVGDHGHDHADDHSHHGDVTRGAGATQPHLLVDVSTIAGEKQISIWCATPEAEDAKAEAQLLADAYVLKVNQTQESPGAEQFAATSKIALDTAQGTLEQAEQALANFKQEHAEQLEPTHTTAGEESDEISPLPPRAIAQPNPRWLEIQQRLAVLRAARDEILKDKTPEHPHVRDLQWQVEQIEAELDVVAQSIVSEVPEVQPANVETTADEPSPELLSRLEYLEDAVAQAERALATARTEWKAASAVKPPASTAVASISGPAKIVFTQGGGASLTGVAGGALIALLFGAFVAARSRVVQKPSTIGSLQSVELLGVPLAGALTTADGPAPSPPEAVNPLWIRRLIFGCELLIAGIALLLLLSACADWQFAAHLVRNPLSALTEAANRLW